MEPTVDCIPCFIDQVLGMTRALALEKNPRDQIVEHALEESRGIIQGQPTPVAMRNVMEKVDKICNGRDPYREFKKDSTKAALELLPRLRRPVEESSQPFVRAVEFSIAGNAIDLAVVEEDELGEIVAELESLEETKFSTNHIDKLKNELQTAKKVLILGDNAGETVFDRLLLEQINAPEIFYTFRGYPILNDATEKEAREAGLHEEATLISTGQRVPGVLLEEAPEELLKIFNEADVVIAKGQGNFETLRELPRPVFHLFKVKCELVADQVNSEVGDFMAWKRKVTQ